MGHARNSVSFRQPPTRPWKTEIAAPAEVERLKQKALLTAAARKREVAVGIRAKFAAQSRLVLRSYGMSAGIFCRCCRPSTCDERGPFGLSQLAPPGGRGIKGRRSSLGNSSQLPK